ncbi:uveal autoantigen with coiled-coil domains and ankyrin repeats-like [Ruditapes philippinarum]|uniref:uveal autoantigen with coiled-coil domains and ankyrin repeats-like n=1 Tax=Ruditapes philippinarum TaxID=129788 RepID=UPI00295B133B|nr:uveal autoantigen with coiled-coil domains and ankyrin repeats-like [Ruditapes philippinarum]XP_060582834.1 uveal autoantigen with coiled-coil domains and ankyrin repeats-like [Ruditapes philippinarum]
MDFHRPLEYGNGRIRTVSRRSQGLTEQGISYTVHHYERGVKEYKEKITLLRRKCEELIPLLKRKVRDIENEVFESDIYYPHQENKLVRHDDFEFEGFGFYNHGKRTPRNLMSDFDEWLSLGFELFEVDTYELLHQLKTQCKRNEEEISLLKGEEDKKQKMISHLNGHIEIIGRDLEKSKLKNENLRLKIKRIQDQVRATLDERDQLKERNANLKRKVAGRFDFHTHSAIKGKTQLNHNTEMNISDREILLRKRIDSEIERRRVKENQLSQEKMKVCNFRREQQKMKTEYERALSSLKKEKLDLENSIRVYTEKNEALERKFNRYKNTSPGNKSASTDKRKTRAILVNDNAHKKSLKAAYKDRNEGENVNYTLRQKAECHGKTTQISELEQRLQETSRTLENKNSDLMALKSELAQFKKHIESYKIKNNELNKRCEKLQKKIKDGEKLQMQIYEQAEVQQGVLRQVSKRESKLIKENEMQKKKIQQLQNEQHLRKEQTINPEKYRQSRKIGNTTDEEKAEMDLRKKMARLKEELEHALRKLQETEIELAETKTRLSKTMGDRLTDNNPNIADLSDRNRPTKLAEKFAELYDNQWTDAFDVLEKHYQNEEYVIEALLQILQDIMTFCWEKANTQMKNLGLELKLAGRDDKGDITVDVRKLLKECRKVVGLTTVGNLQRMYQSHLEQCPNKQVKAALKVGKFTAECVEICWFMVIQDPPVVFAPLLSRGENFNNDYYKPYTISGPKVDYAVWPPLLLHEGGPILAKGVAQGCGKKAAS